MINKIIHNFVYVIVLLGLAGHVTAGISGTHMSETATGDVEPALLTSSMNDKSKFHLADLSAAQLQEVPDNQMPDHMISVSGSRDRLTRDDEPVPSRSHKNEMDSEQYEWLPPEWVNPY